MTFPADRSHWKKAGPRITPQRHDALIAAIRATPNDLEEIAARFDLGINTVRRYVGFAR